MQKIHIAIGVRPDLIRAAHLLDTLISFDANWEVKLIHTGQHHDHELCQALVDELGIRGMVKLSDEGHGTGALQIASILKAYDEYLAVDPPDLILIMGNSNSALACALAGSKRGINLGHLDAGLRSYDPSQAEEMNDAVIDRISSYLFTATEEAVINLIREGYQNTQIIEVGNLRADAVFMNLGHAEDSLALDRYGLVPSNYVLLTMHHPETLQRKDFILDLLRDLEERSETLPILCVLHPKTHYLLTEIYDMEDAAQGNIQFAASVNYREMLNLIKNSALVLTDSQGLQEETSILGVQCLTFGESTNRMITLSKGTNTLHSYDIASIAERIADILGEHVREGVPMAGWDGKAARRIAEFISGIQ